MCLATPTSPGNCLGLLRRYTYDPETGTCSEFEYTGCGGNDNNFSTLRDCLDLCRGVTNEDSKGGEAGAGVVRAESEAFVSRRV